MGKCRDPPLNGGGKKMRHEKVKFVYPTKRGYPEGLKKRGIAYGITWNKQNDYQIVRVYLKSILRMEVLCHPARLHWYSKPVRFMGVLTQQLAFFPNDQLTIECDKDVNGVRVCYVTPDHQRGTF
jgi:hypothetical protein